jgi:hypothetical protein
MSVIKIVKEGKLWGKLVSYQFLCDELFTQGKQFWRLYSPSLVALWFMVWYLLCLCCVPQVYSPAYSDFLLFITNQQIRQDYLRKLSDLTSRIWFPNAQLFNKSLQNISTTNPFHHAFPSGHRDSTHIPAYLDPFLTPSAFCTAIFTFTYIYNFGHLTDSVLQFLSKPQHSFLWLFPAHLSGPSILYEFLLKAISLTSTETIIWMYVDLIKLMWFGNSNL